MIFNFRPAKWSGFGELASACRRLVSMETQLGENFSNRVVIIPTTERWKISSPPPRTNQEIDFSLPEEKRFVLREKEEEEEERGE